MIQAGVYVVKGSYYHTVYIEITDLLCCKYVSPKTRIPLYKLLKPARGDSKNGHGKITIILLLIGFKITYGSIC